MMRRHSLALVSAAAFVSVLVGCGGATNSQEPQAPTPSASSETTQPTIDVPAAPVMPDQAKQPTQAGAEAFLQYWWDVYTYSYQSGDTTLLASISKLESCLTCRDAISEIQQRQSKGETTEGGKYTVTSVELLDQSQVPAYKFTFEFAVTEIIVRDGDGTEVLREPAGKGPGADTLFAWTDGQWVVSYFAKKGLGR